MLKRTSVNDSCSNWSDSAHDKLDERFAKLDVECGVD